jgi:hypothetical protein
MKLGLAASIAAVAILAGACADGPRLTAAAAPVAASPAQCFRYSDIRRNTVSPDQRAIYVNVAGREVFEITVRNYCLRGADANDPLVIRRRRGGQSACGPKDLDVGVASSGVTRQCIVDTVRRMNPAEVAALSPRVRP